MNAKEATTVIEVGIVNPTIRCNAKNRQNPKHFLTTPNFDGVITSPF